MRRERERISHHHDYFPEQEAGTFFMGKWGARLTAELGDHREKQEGQKALIVRRSLGGMERGKRENEDEAIETQFL